MKKTTFINACGAIVLATSIPASFGQGATRPVEPAPTGPVTCDNPASDQSVLCWSPAGKEHLVGTTKDSCEYHVNMVAMAHMVDFKRGNIPQEKYLTGLKTLFAAAMVENDFKDYSDPKNSPAFDRVERSIADYTQKFNRETGYNLLPATVKYWWTGQNCSVSDDAPKPGGMMV